MKDTMYMKLKELRLAWWRLCKAWRNEFNCLLLSLGALLSGDLFDDED